MPIFISYSQQDRDFVDSLAKNLVAAKHNVWIDRWELSLGDSLTQRIEGALTNASAILVIISKNSVESNWCKRELSAGLVRELEEKKTLVMPCIIDDCQIPLFIRDKLYADFRRDPDAAFRLVDRSLARVSNPMQGTFEQLNFHTDWAIDWRRQSNGLMRVDWTFVDHGQGLPYVVISRCIVRCNQAATTGLVQAQRQGAQGKFLRDLLSMIIDSRDDGTLTVQISDHFESFIAWPLERQPGESFEVVVSFRRLGVDNGMDTVAHLDSNLRRALQDMTDKLFEPRSKREQN